MFSEQLFSLRVRSTAPYVPIRSSAEIPVSLGEPAATVDPAIGNAIFAAVGARFRHLPIRPNAVLRALRQT
jgi:CO/xanthine dehydrogenase Mo-binding subunit